MADGKLGKFMGGSPGGVIFRLVLASLVVGALMALLGLNPEDLIRRVVRLIQELFNLGWGTADQVLRWLIYGAVIVVPIWILARLFSSRS